MAASRVISLPPGGIAKDSSDDIRFMSDENLVAVAKKGQRTAFDELHNRHAGKMFRVAHRITGNREDAEDVVQECFLSAFIHVKSVRRKIEILDLADSHRHKRRADETAQESRVERSPTKGSRRSSKLSH